eukprot:scaffold83097_cov69-Phaeocystis_antarctica.AAC.7
MRYGLWKCFPHLILARRGGARSRAIRASGAPLVIVLPWRESPPCVQREGGDLRAACAVPAAATVGVTNAPALRTVRAPAPPLARGRWCRPGVALSSAASCSLAGGPVGDAGGEGGGQGGIPLGGIGVWSPLT